MEQPLQPAHQLCLRDTQLGVGRNALLVERQGEALQFLAEFGGQSVFQLGDGGGVDLAQPGAAGIVEGSSAHLLEKLLDHRADAHHLGGLLDEIRDGRVVVGAVGGLVGIAGAQNDHLVVVIVLTGMGHLSPSACGFRSPTHS